MLPEFETDQGLAELKSGLHFTEEKLVASIERSKTLQKTLLSFEDEMSNLLTISGIGAMCLDKQLNIESATSYMQKLFNITPADVGRPITDLVSNLLYETLDQDVKQVINSLVPWENVVQSKDGQWFNVRILPLLKAGDVVSSVMFTVADITKLKKIENRFLTDTNRVMSVIRNSPIVVWTQDMELRYTWIHNPNPGFVSQEVIGKKDEDLLPAMDALNLTNIKRQVLDTCVGMREDVRTTIKGEPYYYDLVIEPMYDSNSNVIGISCASVEISEQTYKLKKQNR
jgi:two-component system CheB/CheR fusion protein